MKRKKGEMKRGGVKMRMRLVKGWNRDDLGGKDSLAEVAATTTNQGIPIQRFRLVLLTPLCATTVTTLAKTII